MASSLHRLSFGLSLIVGSAPASAQCPQWSGAFGSTAYGSNGVIANIAEVTTPTGRVLYAGLEHPAGPGYKATDLVRWEGLDWVPLPQPPFAAIWSMIGFDDGSGSALFACGVGAPHGVMRWDGTAWSPAGSGFASTVNRLEVTKWNGVDTLFALGAPSVHGEVARWNGSNWETLGGNIPFVGPGTVLSIESFTTAAGTHLYMGGSFNAGGSALARWDGTAWALVPGPNATLYDLTVYDDGAGPALFVGGNYAAFFGGQNFYDIARWDGTTWSNLGGITDTGAEVRTLAVHDDGSGPALYVGGRFLNVAGSYPWSSPGIARWSSQGWAPVGHGFELGAYASGIVTQLMNVDPGTGPRLAAVGGFWRCDGWLTHGPALWGGSNWKPLRPTGDIGGRVRALRRIDAPPLGPALWVGGDFLGVGSAPNVRTIGRFDGVSWQGLDQGILGRVHAIEVFDVAGVPQVHAGGQFDLVAAGQVRGLVRWTGTEWIQVGGGVFGSTGGSGRVDALAVHDDGSGHGRSLFVGGNFASTGGGYFVGIVRWNGTTWSSVGGGTTSQVHALVVYDDGSGPKLYAGGDFQTIGGVNAARIARWNGVTWSPLAGGLDGPCRALVVHDDGGGPALFAGGDFSIAGGVAASRVARWRNGAWSALGTGVASSSSASVTALASVGDAGSPSSSLVAGGTFTIAGGVPVANIAAWSAGLWTAIDPVGTNGNVDAIASFNDGSASAPALYFGGNFNQAGGDTSTAFAKWFDPCDLGVGTAYCLGDGSRTPCPCGNQVGLNVVSGCTNASGTGGTLSADGNAGLGNDSLVLRATGLENRPMLFFQGTTCESGGAGIVFGDGLRCAGGVINRIAVKWSSNGLCVYPEGSEAPLSVQGLVMAPGLRTYQSWYRDPAIGFCTPALFNTTNGVEIEWSAAGP